MRGRFRIASIEVRQYHYCVGVKLSLKRDLEESLSFGAEDDEILHAVIFYKTIHYETATNLKVGDFCRIKAELIKPGRGHALVSIFAIEKL